ncbi:disco-interacting protein 2 homolog C-like isoform X4 [Crassostrea angulata]|uniref:disco-interacting protein 2 homolog C-like isoform X4 n=1 Tax=Magallana angulata TaxID=2784310 RepID=UPI0005C3B29B|nr:disco-interacting protein 2 homolog C-like isoform X4 [Crassostrea angulata]|eukprot:XP_011450436.1 PREDICTED: disco-interacting protein 2 homolog C isoform X4 [Crassostrea gigas]
MMADKTIDTSLLPEDVRLKLEELEIELAEGDITQKGYEKKRTRLLANYVSHSPAGKLLAILQPSAPSPQTAAQRKAHRRLTREDNRYHSEIRTEAVMQALALHKKPVVPLPSKRTSVQYPGQQQRPRERHESSSDDDDSIFGDDQHRDFQRGGRYRDSGASSSSFSDASASPHHGGRGGDSRPHSAAYAIPGNTSRQALADVLQSTRHSQPISQPPDVTNNAKSTRQADRVGHYAPAHISSVRMNNSGNISGLQDDEIRHQGKVSAKIQQLLNTLKRPKRKPLTEFFVEEDDALETPAPDPNAPKPEGSTMSPFPGEPLVIPTGLPRNLESALQRYGSSSYKANAVTVLDQNGKPSLTLTYGKLLARTQKIAYNMLQKTGHKGEGGIKPNDRVALVYPNNDPISFISGFYGCLQAGVIPVPVEVPSSRRDAGGQGIGFLLGSLNVKYALTSEACHKSLSKTASGEVVQFKGWPKLNWLVTDNFHKSSKDWQPPPKQSEDIPAYVEYTQSKDGSTVGVTVTRKAMLCHAQTLTLASNYTEGEVMVCVLDFKRDVGLWHGILCSVFNGMHVIFIPYSLMKVDPASWMKMITKYKASVAIVKSRDMHWGLLAQKDHKDISFASLRLLLVADGANPWSLTSCDAFLNLFQSKGLKPEAICPCASSSEALTVSIRRPGRSSASATGRGILSMQGLSHGVVRVDTENSLTSLTLQDCGQVMPGAMMIVVKTEGPSILCQTDEVGELCLCADYTGVSYWGLQGISSTTFQVQPQHPDGTIIGDKQYVRTGLLGFLGPGGLVFVCGSKEGLMTVSGRRHNTDDIIATVLAVEPMKFIYRGRIAVFSVSVLKDERIIIIAEQRPDCTEEESFQWMSRVLQAVDSIHQVGVYCLALVPPNYLPKTPLGGIHLPETKKKFLEGSLHPANVLMCPHTCVTNLPKPREHRPDHLPPSAIPYVTPSAVHVGNIVQGARMAQAQGRELGSSEEESDTARKVGPQHMFLTEILRWRSQTTPDHIVFTLLNSKVQPQIQMSCSQLHKRAERIGCMLMEKGRLNTGDHVALIYPPGVDLIAAFYGCLYVGCVPVTIRPPHPQNIATTLPTVKMIVEVSKSSAILTNSIVHKLLKSKEATQILESKSWPTILDTDDLPKKKLAAIYRAPTPEMICYLDFSVSTTGMLAGVKMSHASTTALCRSIKLQCELYPSREVTLCLDPYCGLGFVLWCLASIYSGHHSILIAPSEVETNPAVWLTAVSNYKVRDTFCSYGVMELCTRGLGTSTATLKQRGINLACVRTCCVIAEERPRIQLTTSFTKLFANLGLTPRSVSTSFGCRVNLGMALQGASCPDPTTVYVDKRAMRNDRVTLVEKGSPHSLCIMESGKLLPGVKVVIANPDTKGQCADSHLGEIWVNSPHNASGYFMIYGDDSLHAEHFDSHLATGDLSTRYARTGFLGFVRRTELTQSDGGRHDAIFVVGALDETIMLRGMRYHPIDIEMSVVRCHRKICECAVFTWTNLLVVVVELEGSENEALDLVPLVTNVTLEEHYLIVGVVVVVDPGVIPINSRGEKQRMHLRDGFLADQLDPIYVAYNM